MVTFFINKLYLFIFIMHLKKKIIYKNLMNLLFKTKTLKNFSKFPYEINYNVIKFEIKLYLIGLSFNRLILNLDKIIFTLCVVSNFLFFLSLGKPTILFLGCGKKNYDIIIKNSALNCAQVYYEKYPFAGALKYLSEKNRRISKLFPSSLDCIIFFYSSYNSFFLKDALKLNIPVIGLLETNTTSTLKSVTYPIICFDNLMNCYFFATYFSLILNSKNIKRNLFKYTHYSPISFVKKSYRSNHKFLLQKSFINLNFINFFLTWKNYNLNFFFYNKLFYNLQKINYNNLFLDFQIWFLWKRKILENFYYHECYFLIFFRNLINFLEFKILQKNKLKNVNKLGFWNLDIYFHYKKHIFFENKIIYEKFQKFKRMNWVKKYQYVKQRKKLKKYLKKLLKIKKLNTIKNYQRNIINFNFFNKYKNLSKKHKLNILKKLKNKNDFFVKINYLNEKYQEVLQKLKDKLFLHTNDIFLIKFLIKKFKNKFKTKFINLLKNKNLNLKNMNFLNLNIKDINDEILEYKDLSKILKELSPYKPIPKKRPYWQYKKKARWLNINMHKKDKNRRKYPAWRFERYLFLSKKKKFVNYLRKPKKMSTWTFWKSRLFTEYFAWPFKKRRKKKRVRIFRAFKWLTKLSKRGYKGRHIYTKVPKKLFLKKKVVLKKVLYYYYKLPIRKNFLVIQKYINKSKNKNTINSTKNLLNILESKLCIFITRLKLASNVFLSNILITKGNIIVNGKIIYEPGYILKQGDIIQLRKGKKEWNGPWMESYNYYIRRLMKLKWKRWKLKKIFFRLKNALNPAYNYLKTKKLYNFYLFRLHGYDLVPLRRYRLNHSRRRMYLNQTWYAYWKTIQYTDSWVGPDFLNLSKKLNLT